MFDTKEYYQVLGQMANIARSDQSYDFGTGQTSHIATLKQFDYISYLESEVAKDEVYLNSFYINDEDMSILKTTTRSEDYMEDFEDMLDDAELDYEIMEGEDAPEEDDEKEIEDLLNEDPDEDEEEEDDDTAE